MYYTHAHTQMFVLYTDSHAAVNNAMYFYIHLNIQYTVNMYIATLSQSEWLIALASIFNHYSQTSLTRNSGDCAESSP
jgi:hypothetical protein